MSLHYASEKEFVTNEIDKLVAAATTVHLLKSASQEVLEKHFLLDSDSYVEWVGNAGATTREYKILESLQRSRNIDGHSSTRLMQFLVEASTLAIASYLRAGIEACGCEMCKFFWAVRTAVAGHDKEWKLPRGYKGRWREWELDSEFRGHRAIHEMGDEPCSYSLYWAEVIELWEEMAEHVADYFAREK